MNFPISPEMKKIVRRVSSFKNTGHPMTEAQKRRRNAAIKDLEDRIGTLEEHASGAWECLDMVRETLTVFLGEEDMKGSPPMFYPEAIRHAMFLAQRGDFLPKNPVPPESSSPPPADQREKP